MTKCDICKNKVETLFLGKIDGTYIKIDGKRKIVCSSCQKRLNNRFDDEL
ncbi:hypothetical protein J4216_02365 [Candidatus Woesearchaeota archaeon]|nr:hypothetical protein [Candidatus Woesearchaeota archaeon]